MSFRRRMSVVENLPYIKYYKDNINALTNKEVSSGKLMVY
jgi:hypothetical protein